MKHKSMQKFYSMWSKQDKKRKLRTVICAAVILCAAIVLITGAVREGERRTILSGTAQLEKAIQIGELSTSQFTCNGIAEVHDPDDDQQVVCYVCYEAQIKVGIHMDQVRFEIDPDKKILTVYLPPIEIMSSTVDPASLDYLHKKSGLELQDVLAACLLDVEETALEADAMFEMARENVVSAITALIYPLVEQGGYEIVWEGGAWE